MARGLTAILLLALSGTAFPQGAGDPTRPPMSLGGVDASSGVVAPGALQSVIIPKRGKASALIDGQLIKVGERYGDSVLVAVKEDRVVLKSAAGQEILYLTPDVEKRVRRPGKEGHTRSPRAGKSGESK